MYLCEFTSKENKKEGKPCNFIEKDDIAFAAFLSVVMSHIFSPISWIEKSCFFGCPKKKVSKVYFLVLLVLLVRPLFRRRWMSLQHLWQIFSLFLKQKQKKRFWQKKLETFSSSFSRMNKKEIEMTLTKTFSGFFNSPNINKLPFH